MTSCPRPQRFRFCSFEQDRRLISGYIPERIARLMHKYTLEGRTGSWRIKSMDPSTICAGLLATKHLSHPRLYPVLEASPA